MHNLVLEKILESLPSFLYFSSLMDREVTLLAEMDKVKADASKYCIFQYACHIPPCSCLCSSHDMIT